MSIKIPAPSNTTNFEPCPAGLTSATCYRILDMGLQDSTYQGVTTAKHKVLLQWITEHPREDGQPFMVSKSYLLSLHPKSTLYRDLSGWRGKKFADEDLVDFELSTVLGKRCMLSIVHSENNGTVYANVDSIMPVSKGAEDIKIPADLASFVLAMDDTDSNQKFAHLSDGLKDKVINGWQRLAQAETDARDKVRAQPAEAPASLDDEIPF